MVLQWSLGESKFHQVSWILLSILADLNRAVVCLHSSSHFQLLQPLEIVPNQFTNPLVTVRRAPFTTGITVTFIFHNFFCSLARFRDFQFYLAVRWDGKVHYSAGSLFLLTGHLAEIRRSVFITKS